ncbi:MAG: YfiR family protein [Bacteroidetes bacterium]|nr:YfiR family protein [Bacteroidota bacterium]
MKQAVNYIFAIGFFVFIGGKSEKVFSQDKDYKAYTLFLYNFIKYVEWPPDEKNEFIIGVAGDSPIQKELQVLSENKKAKGKKIIVKIISSAEEAASCNLIYIPSQKSSMLKLIAEKTKGKPVLIVAEREGLAKKGAAISFVVEEDDALKFDINKSALDSQSLKVANVLMQLGSVVG